jgi:PAS domain-containing protein
MNIVDFDYESQELARTSSQDRSWLSGFWEKALQRLLTVMVKLRGSHNSGENSSLVNGFILLTVCMSINVLQLLSLATSCDLGSQEFVFWSGLRFVRLDWIAHKTASLWAFTIAAQIVIATKVCLLIVAMASGDSLSRLHDTAVKGLKLVSHPSFSVVVIPFQMALLTTIKYAISPKTTVLEYEDLPVASLGANPGTCLLSLLCFFALLALELMKMVLATQLGYSPYSHSSRFTTSFDIGLRLAFSALVVLYLFTELMHPIVYRAVTFGLSVYMAYSLYEAVPYRLRMMNYMHFALCLFLAWAVVAVQIGELLINSYTSFLLMSLVAPFLVLSVLNVLKEKLNKVEAKADKLFRHTKKLKEFEFSLRVIVPAADTEDKLSMVLDHFFAFRDRCRFDDKMLDILLVYFCIDVRKDNKLALVKLGRLQRPGFNFEARFHESYIRDYLSTCKDLGEVHEYLEFKAKFDQIKKLDEEVTVTSYKLWHEISLKSPNTESIDRYLTSIYQEAKEVRLGYEQIMRRFPEANGVVELFTSFVTTVISEEESNAIKLAFARLSQNSNLEQKSMRNLTLFKDTYGVMLVDAHPDNFAKITYANEVAAQLFGVARSVIVGNDLDDFIPPPANRNHVKKMLNFVNNSKHTHVDLPFNVFIYGGNKFLRDCRIIVRLTALEAHPVFVVSVIDLPNTREVAIVDDDGMIYSHSQHLPQVLSLHQDRLEGKYIEDLLPIDFKNLELFKAYEVTTPDKVVKYASAILSVHNVSLKLLFFFTDDSEFQRWKLGRHKQDIADLTTLHEVSEDIVAIEQIEETSPRNPLRKAKFMSNTTLEQSKPTKLKQNEEDQALIDDEEEGLEVKQKPSASHSSKTPTSSRQIAIQSQVLKVFMTALKVTRTTTLISALSLVLGSIAMLIYLIVSVENVDQVFMLKMFSRISYDFIISGFASRLLMQAREGLVLYDVDKLHDILTVANADLRDQLSNLNDNKALISAYGFEELYDHELMRSWQLENGEPKMRMKNLIDVMGDFIWSTQVAVTLSLEDCSITNSHLYYSYRNGLGEAFDLMNSTTYQYLHKQRGFMADVENGLLEMFGVCGALLTVCILMVVPSLVYLQRSNDEFWGKLTNLTNQKALDLKFQLIRRLNSNFEPEISEELESYVSSDMRRVRKGDKPLPMLKFTIWRKVALKLILFVVLSGLLFAIFYAVCFVNIRDTLEIYNERGYYSNQMKVTFLSSIVWSEESNFKQQVIGTEVPSYLYSETHGKAEEEIAKLNNVMVKLYDPKYNIVEFDRKSMLRDYFGSTTPHFHHGTQPAAVNLYQDLISHEETPFETEDFKAFIGISLELVGYLDEIYDSIVEATETNISKSISQAVTVTVCYTLGILMLSFAIYKRMFDALAAKLERNMSVIRLILD